MTTLSEKSSMFQTMRLIFMTSNGKLPILSINQPTMLLLSPREVGGA